MQRNDFGEACKLFSFLLSFVSCDNRNQKQIYCQAGFHIQGICIALVHGATSHCMERKE